MRSFRSSHLRMHRVVTALVIVLGVLLLSGGERPATSEAQASRTEVVVALGSPPLAHGVDGVGRVDAEQRAFRRLLERELPEARLRWRYRLVLNGFAVDLPSDQVSRLAELAGVRDVYGSAAYGPQLDDSPGQIGAPALWGPTLDTAGQGMKIGIIDTGIDHEHAFFDPAGYAMPAGFPKGQLRYTNAKVIVARAFAPRSARSPAARLAFDPAESDHGTHVAGIAAGNAQNAGERQSGRLGCRASGVHRQLQGARPHGLGPEPERQLARARRGDRSGGPRRHGRDQPLSRRAGDRAEP